MSRYLFLILISIPIFAQSQVRKYSNEFLAIGASARGLGMSNTVVASVNDVTSCYYNPAGLGKIKTTIDASFMHSEYFAGITNFDYLGVAIKASKYSAVGVSVVRFAADNIPNTYDLIGQDGAINYLAIKSFSIADYAALISYGYYKQSIYYKKHSYGYGGTLKVIHRTVGEFGNAWGFGFDVGGIYEIDDYNTISFTARDVTTTVNAWSFSFTEQQKQVLANTGNDIPVRSTEITIPRLIPAYCFHDETKNGIGYNLEAALDMTFDGRRNTLISTKAISIDPHIGLEGNFKKLVYLRAGVGQFQKYSNDIPGSSKQIIGFTPSVGAGVRLNKICIDYAFTDLGNQNIGLYSHVIGIKLGVDRKKKRK
ncbi:MAG: hypothetical protein NTX03_11285 [Bacteroidetes bacterium]|nr:hypothetical protein [Bacteroidota bacterium]